MSKFIRLRKFLLTLPVAMLAVFGLFGNVMASSTVYTVKPGDTLCEIGKQFNVPCKEMVANFPQSNPNLIHPGDKFEFGRADGLLGGLVSKPYTFTPNTVISSAQINSDFDTLYTLVNGNIDNANIKTAAGILASKISGTAIVSTGQTAQSIYSTTTIYGGLIVSSTSNYFRVPVMTLAQRDALTGLEGGIIIYVSDSGQFYIREGGSWAAISPAAETATANSTTKGIVEEATTAEILVGTATGGTGARLYISPSSTVTSSLGSASAGNVLVLRSTDGRLDSSFGGTTSSLATLNTNVLVVQNPASASTSPSANGIPIADNSGKLGAWGKFGGDGSDGALNVTSGTTTLSAASSPYLIKNYSSLNISAGAVLQLVSSSDYGTIAIIRVLGNCTIAGTLDARGFGSMAGVGGPGGSSGAGTAGTSATTSDFDSGDGLTTHGGVLGAAGTLGGGAPAAGTGGTKSLSTFYTNSTNTLYGRKFLLTPGAAGGGGGGGASSDSTGGVGGNGGSGGGAVLLECGGVTSFTGTIKSDGGNGVAGTSPSAGSASSGGGGGGGGGGGHILFLYNSSTSLTGTITVTGGNGGNGGNGRDVGASSAAQGGAGGGGGGSLISAGGNGGNGGTAGGNGSNGSTPADGGTQGTGGTGQNNEGGGGGGGGGGSAGRALILKNLWFF